MRERERKEEKRGKRRLYGGGRRDIENHLNRFNIWIIGVPEGDNLENI